MKWLIRLMVTSFLFFPEKDFYELPQDYGLEAQDVFITTQDNVRLHGWFFPSQSAANPPPAGEGNPAKATLLFFHGNAGNISGRLFKAQGWVERGVSVLLLDYRGYGKSEGEIKEGSDLIKDAESALKWLEESKKIPTSQIILYGESIGSYPAIQLARRSKWAGLVLEGAFTSLTELAKLHYSMVPEFLLRDFQMNNLDSIKAVKAPVFMMHGELDEICPKQMGERLYELAPSPKEFYVVQGGQHNDLPLVAGSNFFEYPYRFLIQK